MLLWWQATSFVRQSRNMQRIMGLAYRGNVQCKLVYNYSKLHPGCQLSIRAWIDRQPWVDNLYLVGYHPYESSNLCHVRVAAWRAIETTAGALRGTISWRGAGDGSRMSVQTSFPIIIEAIAAFGAP